MKKEIAGPGLSIDCPRCRARAGERCKDYRGKNKFMCAVRKKPPPAPKLQPKPQPEEEFIQPAFFDGFPTTKEVTDGDWEEFE